ncbi:MAG: ParA family partition ATPase [Rhodothermia bacterium]|nr:MAG: ParA family partition ATPase [Rhodothermia bacterium]
MATVIACLSPKGGGGKTTIVTNVARAFQTYGTVIIIDTDPQQTAGNWADHAAEDYPPVWVGETKNLKMDVERLKSLFDFVFIDGAASLDEVIADALAGSDVVLIPVRPSLADIWAISDMVDVIERARSARKGRPSPVFVISQQGIGTRLAAGVETPLGQYDIPVLENRTSIRIAYAEALSAGYSVIDYQPKGKAAAEIKAIANEIKELIDAEV